ncbi:MAG: flagellar protein FliS [Candidatus Paracaedibacteraceae bacterium]|nr:flagellar protein FliS [Candidatus Paracaedibacteraceae bacterium]
MYNAQMRHYHKAEAITASKMVQVAILLDHCVGLLRRAKVAIETKDYEQRHHCIDKVMVIISSIQSSLAVDRSPEVGEISNFFNNIVAFLLEVSLKEDAALCEQVQIALSEMASIWRLADSHKVASNTTTLPMVSESMSMDA